MQAHPLSTTAARTSTLSLSPQAPRSLGSQSASLVPHQVPHHVPDQIRAPQILSPTRAAPHLGLPVYGNVTPSRSRAAIPEHNLDEHNVAEHAGLAHDAGNLLGALQIYCDLLSVPGVLRPEHRHYAQDLHLIAARSTTLIRRLLLNATAAADSGSPAGPGHAAGHAPAQPDASVAPAAPPPTPASVLSALAPVLERIAAGAGEVTVSAASHLPSIPLPAEALERIVVNLVRNAAEAIRSSREASRQPGQIRVAMDNTGDAVRLLVEDDGPGMPPAVAAAFLRPLPLLPGTTRGLGHRIVHELAAETGATLSIRVRPGRGTAFCLRWPLPETAGRSAASALEPLHRDDAADRAAVRGRTERQSRNEPEGPGGVSRC